MKPILAAVLILSAVWAAGASMPPPVVTGAQAVAAPANTRSELSVLKEALSDSPQTKSAPAPLPAAAMPPVQAPQKTEEAQKTEPAAAKMPDCVAPLQDLVAFHNKEIASLREMIDRWNAKVEFAFRRRQILEKEVHSRNLRVDTLLMQESSAAKHEANRLKKEIKRINKDISAVDKELAKQSRDLAGEVRDVSKDAQQALRDAYQKASQDIQNTHR